ncbi:MAG: hypothetical protein FJX72_19205, partial [Armatimonadetes bacterium]|nr:hypothetical protein [Armatimonadota bacterium]
MRVRAATLGATMLMVVAVATARFDEAALGPARDVGLVEDFHASSAGAWKVSQGANVKGSATFGYTLPGIATTLFRATPRLQDSTDREPSHNWFALARTEPMPPSLPTEFEGFRVALGSGAQAQWWISMTVTASDGKPYSRLLTDSVFPAGRMVEYLLPLDTFRAGDVALTVAAARTARSIEFAFSVPGADLYLDKITVYRRSRQAGWLTFGTSHDAHSLYERGEAVEMRFTLGGVAPSGAKGFRWEVRQLDGAVALSGTRALDGSAVHRVAAPVRRHGYYEVRAWWTDGAGRRLAQDSCVRAEGTTPEGIGTFAILPSTVAENTAMFRRLGRSSFFGLHGDFMGLADRVGLAWRFGYEKWPWLEPTKPDRTSGMAEWARKRMAEPPMPRHALHILPFRGNMGEEVPSWARAPEGAVPPFASWDDYLTMIRDSVRVQKHRYPGMSPRLYGCAWEANLNMPPYNATPPAHSPGQLVELFRRTREAIRSVDPSGLVLGPCPSVMQTGWFETMFEAGVGAHIDAG